MNKKRTAELTRALKSMAEAQAAMNLVLENVRDIRDDLSDSIDNMSDGARNSENGETMVSDHDALNEFIDAIDSFDLKGAMDALGQNIEMDTPDAETAKLSEAERDARREARLPVWAQERIKAAEKARETALQSVDKLFGEPTGDPGEFAIYRHSGPFRGKIIPSETIEVPALGLHMRVDKWFGEDGQGWGLSITGERGITVRPQASNVLMVCGSPRQKK